MATADLKELKKKTGSCARCVKDLVYSEKEIKSQQERIEKVKADDEKDEHDVKKQEEVLAEYEMGKADEYERLKKYMDDLEELIGIISEKCEEENDSGIKETD